MSTRCAHLSEGCSPEFLQHYTSKSVEAICGHSSHEAIVQPAGCQRLRIFL
jgi:hypothetical protein